MNDRIIIETENGKEEYVKTSLLKMSALRVKPLRWRDSGLTHTSKSYKIERKGGGFILKYNDVILSGSEPVSLVKAQALAQKHHEAEILSCLDLGAWSEVK